MFITIRMCAELLRKLVPVVMLLNCILDVIALTGCLVQVLYDFIQFFRSNFEIFSRIRPRTLPSRSFPNHYSLMSAIPHYTIGATEIVAKQTSHT